MALKAGYVGVKKNDATKLLKLPGIKKIGDGLTLDAEGELSSDAGSVVANPEGTATAGNLTKLQLDDDIYAIPTYEPATHSADGLMSSQDKEILDGLKDGTGFANGYRRYVNNNVGNNRYMRIAITFSGENKRIMGVLDAINNSDNIYTLKFGVMHKTGDTYVLSQIAEKSGSGSDMSANEVSKDGNNYVFYIDLVGGYSMLTLSYSKADITAIDISYANTVPAT